MSDTTENSKVESDIVGSDYAPGVLDEPSTYRPDKGGDDAGLSSTLAAGTDVDELQNGGPHRTPGMMTTTGGNAGPNSFRDRPRSGPGVANTTTGDATTGSMAPPADSKE